MKLKPSLVAMLVVLGAVVVSVSAEDALPLPDYTKAPYHRHGEKDDVLTKYPEFGTVHLVLYTTSERPAVGGSAILIGTTADSDTPVYAEWMVVVSSSKYLVRIYLRKENAWVFVMEVIGQQALPKQEEQKEDR